MYIVRQSALPVIGMSHEFVGKEQGPTGISFFLVSSDERDSAFVSTNMTTMRSSISLMVNQRGQLASGR